MYQAFFGLQKDAFRMTPDPSAICMTVKHREALAGLSYAILRHKGFTVLTGDAGTGKTTLISRVVQALPREKVSFSVILNSALTPAEFLESALLDFGLKDFPTSKAQRLEQLRAFLLSEYKEGRSCVLVIDEAQDLSVEVLEEVRLLSNCELPERKLLQIILSGQNELEDLLNRQALRQLKQRIEVHLRISALSEQEVNDYIRFRWAAAGGHEPLPFEPAAIAAIGEYSNGIPRLINTICDHSLLAAFGQETKTVVSAHVEEAALDLGLTRQRDGIAPVSADRTTQSLPDPPTAETGVAGAGLQDAAAVPVLLPSLARYDPAAAPPSRFSRWVSRLHFAN